MGDIAFDHPDFGKFVESDVAACLIAPHDHSGLHVPLVGRSEFKSSVPGGDHFLGNPFPGQPRRSMQMSQPESQR